MVHPELRQLLPLLAPDAAALDGAGVEADVGVGLLAEVRRLTAERDQARGLAWSYEHRLFDYSAIGIELDEAGNPLEPAWLSSPAAPYERVLDADLTRFTGSGYGTVHGQQVIGLAVGDCVWLTDKGAPPGAVDTVYVQVREVANGWVRVQVLTDPTDVRHAP